MSRIIATIALAALGCAAQAQVTPAVPTTDASGVGQRPRASAPRPPARRVPPGAPGAVQPESRAVDGSVGVQALGEGRIAAEVARLEALNRLRDSMEALRSSIGLGDESGLGADIDQFIRDRVDPVEQALSVRMTHEVLAQLPKVTIQPIVLIGQNLRGFVGDGTGFV